MCYLKSSLSMYVFIHKNQTAVTGDLQGEQLMLCDCAKQHMSDT